MGEAAEQKDQISIQDIAAAELAAANGDVQRAAQTMADKVRADRMLRDALTEPLIEGACYDAIRALARHERSAVWNAPSNGGGQGRPAPILRAVPPGADRQRERMAAQLEVGGLMDFRLPGFKLLRDATREEIIEAATFYAAQSRDMRAKALWLSAVAAELKPGQTPGSVLTEPRLRELRSKNANA